MVQSVRLRSVHPLVRYVDRDHAVIDAHFSTLPAIDRRDAQPACRAVKVSLEIDGSDGFHDEGETRLQLHDHHGSIRFEVVRPERWWPSGMGAQALYTLTLHVEDPGYGGADSAVTFGLTSVRRDRVLGDGFAPSLLVNGEICDYDTIVVVDRVDENQLLPATGETLLLVRDHFGPDNLYRAADHAGILLIQCVPLSPDGAVEAAVTEQIARLASHPSLAGYYVGHLGELSDQVAAALRQHDPTRPVFRRFPLEEAA
jgi:hypothetical protein